MDIDKMRELQGKMYEVFIKEIPEKYLKDLEPCEVFGHDIVPILGFENSYQGEQCRYCGKMNEELDGDIIPQKKYNRDLVNDSKTELKIFSQRSPSISEIIVDENDKLNSGYYDNIQKD